MRIGIDIRLKNESGIGRYISNLIKYLNEADRKNEYLFFSPDISWHSLEEQILMPAILLREKLDLVHFPYFNVPVFYPGKFVVTIHDLTIHHFFTGKATTLNPLLYKLKRIAYKLVFYNAIHRSEKIIVPTESVKKEILKHYKINPAKVVVIYEGVDFKINPPVSHRSVTESYNKQNLKGIEPQNYFLYVGNAYPHKNLEKLLLAYQRIIKLNDEKRIKLIFAGKEDLFYKGLQKQVKSLGFKDEIIFPGFVDDRRLNWLYQNALALVLPSLMEGFGLTALEAMENDCLVLASNIPALREICQGSALYFNPEDVSDISRILTEVIRNPERYKIKTQQGKKIASKFRWEKMVRETIKTYENCLSLR